LGYKSPSDVLASVAVSSDNYGGQPGQDGALRVVGSSAGPAMPVSTGTVTVSVGTALPVSTGVVSITAAAAVPVSTGTVTVSQSAVSMLIDPHTTIAASAQAAVAASTAYQLPNQTCVAVALKGRPGNTGNVWIGGSSVTNTNGFPLDAGDAISLQVNNMNLLYYWCDTANDRICWIVIA
jgi:hypothetical protein